MKTSPVKIIFPILLFCLSVFSVSKASAQIDSIKALYNSATSVDEKLKHLDKIARLYQQSQLDSAKVYARKEIKLAVENENSKYTILGNNWLGRAFFVKGYNDSAIIYFRKCYDVSVKAENKLYAAYSLQSIANYYLEKSLFDSTIYNYRKSLELLKELDDERGISNVYLNLSLTYRKMGDYGLAMKNVYKAIQNRQKNNDIKGIANGYKSLANIYLQMENHDSAIFYYRKVLSFPDVLKRSTSLSSLYNNIGVAYEGMFSYDSSLYYYKKALKIRSKADYYEGVSISYMNIGNIFKFRKQYDSALAYYEKSRKIFSDIKYDHGLTHNYFVTANLYDSISQFDSSQFYYKKCYNLAVKYKIPDYISKAAYGLSYSYSMLGNDSEALSFYKIYKSYEDSLFNKETSEKIGWARAKFSFDKKLFKEEMKRKQLKKYIVVISTALFILIFLLWFIYRQLHLKKKLIKKLIAKDKAINCPPFQKTVINDKGLIIAGKHQTPDKKIIEEIKTKLSEWEKQELFTNPKADIEMLSEFCNTNTSYLSFVLNRSLQLKFTEWVNRLRLKKAKELLEDPDKLKKLNISGIAIESGFNSKATFYKYFKQDMEITPNRYIKSI